MQSVYQDAGGGLSSAALRSSSFVGVRLFSCSERFILYYTLEEILIMRLTQPQYFYHVSRKNLGENPKLYPRKSEITNRPENEPKLARICVAPSISKCIAAIGRPVEYEDCLFIYRTYQKVKARYAWGIPDQSVISERWLVRPTTFLLIYILPNSVFENIPFFHCGQSLKKDLKEQKQARQKILCNLKKHFNKRFLKSSKVKL